MEDQLVKLLTKSIRQRLLQNGQLTIDYQFDHITYTPSWIHGICIVRRNSLYSGSMNVAPYIIARLNNWRWSDDERIRQGMDFVERLPFLSSLFEFFSDLRNAHNLYEIDDRNSAPVGLYSVPVSKWEQILDGLDSREDLGTLPDRFVRGIVIDKPHIVLLFPDDEIPFPNISLFAPSCNESGDMVLHTISLALNRDASQFSGEILSSSDGCTLAVSGKLPNRRFYCGQTGCSLTCSQGVHMKKGAVKTIVCKC